LSNNTDANMKYIYSPSYPSLRLICYFIHQGEDITVISHNQDIIKLCLQLNWPCIPFNFKVKGQPKIRECWNLFKIIRFKRELQELFNEISDQCKQGILYYTISGIDVLGMDIISRFATQRQDLNVTYWPEDNRKPGKEVFFQSIESWIYKYYCNLLYKPMFRYELHNDGVFIVVRRSFISKYHINEIEIPGIYGMDVYQRLPRDFMHADYLLLGGYSIEMDDKIYVARDLLDIYEFIKGLYPNVYYKPHPGAVKLDSYFDDYKIYPSHIPAEFLADNLGVVVGAASASLAPLARKGVRCISVLDLVGTREGFSKQFWKDKMTSDSEGTVLFPQSRDELKNYLFEPLSNSNCS
jgi:hypothetical protein